MALWSAVCGLQRRIRVHARKIHHFEYSRVDNGTEVKSLGQIHDEPSAEALSSTAIGLNDLLWITRRLHVW